ncbi:hypothetical protein [Providencia sp. PROV041]|uniref:hypothetical protein n=1 Tax=Providencia sp. PROV041 TaxID=2949772 RepID=UPI00234BFDE8|nr:hypothetical protein [Providencia sp. PROV041]
MASPTPRMDAAQFDRVASKCRWSERSLGVARALLVDGVPLPDAAAAHDMSVKQARVLLVRFAAKAESERLEAFMQREKPKLATTALEPYSSEVRTLRDKGYTIEQIVAFFKENGVKTSPTTVRNFLRSIRA